VRASKASCIHGAFVREETGLANGSHLQYIRTSHRQKPHKHPAQHALQMRSRNHNSPQRQRQIKKFPILPGNVTSALGAVTGVKHKETVTSWPLSIYAQRHPTALRDTLTLSRCIGTLCAWTALLRCRSTASTPHGKSTSARVLQLQQLRANTGRITGHTHTHTLHTAAATFKQSDREGLC